MSVALPALSPIPFPDEKPSNRGRFSDDRQYWEEVHKRRYLQWQLGSGIEEIATEEGVTYNAVKHSILWCEARIPGPEVVAGRATRLRLQAFARLSKRYLDELEVLMGDPNPIIRSRALEHFRKTVGLDVSGGVHVNVNQRTAVVQNGKVRSFEEALDAVRLRHAKTETDRNAIAGPIASSSAEPLADSPSDDGEVFERTPVPKILGELSPHPAR